MLRGFLYTLYEHRLLAEVVQRPLPRHLGLIQDGHRRYAREWGLPSLMEAYRRGAVKAEEVLTWCADLRIPLVTLWWLSTENLRRHPEEVAPVLEVIERKVTEWAREGLADRLQMRMRPIGKLDLLPPSVIRALQIAESATQQHDGLLLNVGVGYGGRQEILDAIQGYLQNCFARKASPEEIVQGLTPDAMDHYLYTHDCPDPDLIIRTSGEVRLSGFLLWQSAYSEFYFCDAHWPAFRKIDFLRAIRSYQQRHRRFGK